MLIDKDNFVDAGGYAIDIKNPWTAQGKIRKFYCPEVSRAGLCAQDNGAPDCGTCLRILSEVFEEHKAVPRQGKSKMGLLVYMLRDAAADFIESDHDFRVSMSKTPSSPYIEPEKSNDENIFEKVLEELE